jgi:hypothetical protein
MGQKRFLMSQKELQRYHVINKVIEGRINTTEASTSLGLSRRQIFRLKAKVLVKDIQGIIHGNRGRVPSIKKPEKLIAKIRHLYTRTYCGFNITHFTEKLNEVEGIDISRETVRQNLRKHNLIGQMKRASKHRSRRERMPMVGMMLQHDTSEHDWLEGRGPKLKLIASIDDANNEVPYALFVDEDGTLPNMEAMKKVIQIKGVPISFYVDGASHNKTQRGTGIHYSMRGEHKETQIQRALLELGINLIIAGSPQAKGRVERLFGTFQDRLISELRLRKCTAREEANRFLHKKFLHEHNRKFTVIPARRKSAYRKLPGRIDLNRIFCIKEKRTVQGDNTISYKGRIFQIVSQNGRMGYTRAKVEVQEWTDGSIHIEYKGKELVIQELSERPRRVDKKPTKFNLKNFARLEESPQAEFCRMT